MCRVADAETYHAGTCRVESCHVGTCHEAGNRLAMNHVWQKLILLHSAFQSPSSLSGRLLLLQ